MESPFIFSVPLEVASEPMSAYKGQFTKERKALLKNMLNYQTQNADMLCVVLPTFQFVS